MHNFFLHKNILIFRRFFNSANRFDFSLFQGRLSGTLEYYIQDTKDLLLGVSLPSTSGVNSYTANVGKTRNKGIEFSLNGTILDGKNGWTWDAGINLYANKNKLVALASGADRDLGNRWLKNVEIFVVFLPGGNVGMIKVEYTGDYNEDGTPTRQINSDDMQIMDMDPDLMGGFNTTVGYKNFDLTVIGSFQIGGKLVSALHSSNGYLNLLSGRRNNINYFFIRSFNKS
jgi:outer membrane receptor protein involved in Fe transport